MRRTWLNTITAALCAAGAAATTAEAGPADLLNWKKSSAADAPAPVAQTMVPPATQGGRPSAEISPYKHPIKYLGAAFSEMPLPGRSKEKVLYTRPEKHDVLSLDTPTGPATPHLKIAMAQLSEQHSDIAGARRHYQDALRTWPGQVDVLRAAARMEDRQGQLQVAESLYRQALASNAQHAGAHNDLGILMARQGKLDASVQEIEQAVRLEPSNARYRNNAAVVLVSMQQDQRALQHLSAVHGGAEANYNMGQLLVQRNRPMDAAPYFSAALEMNPAMQPAYEALSKLQGPGMGQVPSVAEQPMPVAPQQPVSADPQQGSPTGPQMSFPATARNPAWGTSSYVPPGYYAPTQMQPQAVPYVGQAQPRHLPPVQGQQQQPQAGTLRR